MTIYTLCNSEDIKGLYGECVANVEDIEQLAIEAYWGTLTEPEHGRLKVTIDMGEYTVKIIDTFTKLRVGILYDILKFEMRAS